MTEFEWFQDLESEEEYIEVHEYDITSVPNDFNIKTIFELMDAGIIKIPSFQRNYVWDQYRASKLIESLVIGLPIPQIFLYEENRNSFLVIDGQQRLMSIYYFIKQRFPKKDGRSELRRIFDQNGRMDDATLSDDEYFNSFNLKLSENVSQKKNRLHKLNYSNLGDLKFAFDMRPLRVVVIRQNTPLGDDSSIYEIFNRLNSGGLNLRPQEIRASMYHSRFYDMLYRLNANSNWRLITGSKNADLHMKDVEIILRSFAAVIDSQSYKSSLRAFINSFSRKAKSIDATMTEYFENVFSKFVDVVVDTDAEMFISQRGKFNISLFESVFYGYLKDFVTRVENPHRLRINKSYVEEIRNNAIFQAASTKSSGSSSNYLIRLKTAYDIINSAEVS